MKKKEVNASAEPQVIDQGRFEEIAISDIRISKTNRKHFNQEKLSELAASIKDIGVAQPILIRPVTPSKEEPEIYEIVAGERRFRASKLAEVKTIPAMIRNLTDHQAAKIQILENLQREDPHELEEALGYQALMLGHGYNADQLADELKKSRSYIYSRLKLCALAEPLHSDFLERKFSASIALLVARIPVPELQMKAMTEITKPDWRGDIPSFREAKELLQNRYMLDLSKATFDIKDAKLLARAGNCITCPKRTGNQKEVFADIDSNICTDPNCFEEKVAALNYRKIDSANKKGIQVIEGDEAKNYAKNEARQNSEVELYNMGWSFDRVKKASQNKSAYSLIDKTMVPSPARVLVMPDGKVVELFKKEVIQDLLEKSGHALTVEEQIAYDKELAEQPPSDAYLLKQEQDRALELRAEMENKFRYHLYRLVREKAKIEFSSPAKSLLVALAKILINQYSIPCVELIEYYDNVPNSEEEAGVYLDQNKDKALSFILDIVIGNDVETNKWRMNDPEIDTGYRDLSLAAESLGIDVDQVRKDVEKPVDSTPVKRPLLTLKKTINKGSSVGSSDPVVSPNTPWPYPEPKAEAFI